MEDFFMNRDYILIIVQFIVTIGLLIRYIPRNKIREANLVFLFKLLLTLVLGLTVSELRLIEYPVRLFPHATKTSFTFEFFVYPSICAIFNLNYPEKKSNFIQFMYYSYFCSMITVLEIFAEKYTNILEYINWTWYITWISLFITFFISRKYYLWFFKLNQDN